MMLPDTADSDTGAIAKLSTGIEGFDEITRGGLPRGRTTLVLGTPGAGKTVFALQALVSAAAREGRAGIFVAFEESSRDIVANAATFGWDLPALEEKKLFFLDAYLSPTVVQAGHFDLAGMLAGLEAKAEEMQASTIVFDAIDVLLTHLDDPAAERLEVHRINEWLKRTGLTGIITAKNYVDDPLSMARYGFLQFMADTVILLHHRLADRVALRGLRVMKYRGSDFSGNEFPMVIAPSGIEVATFGPLEFEYEVSSERVSSGVPDIDAMLGGGYFRGSGVLITGAPGTAKTTLGGSFTDAACRRGEKALYVSFDEAASQLVRNLTSVGLDLEEHLQSGALRLHTVRTEVHSAEEHLIILQKLIREFEPRNLVIDPISAFNKSGGKVAAVDAAVRLLDFAKSRGITVLCTSLTGGAETMAEMTDMQVSTIADTWIHLSYVILGGERNRAISIVKSRGTSHSNQVRELVLTPHGATLSDVYVAGGEVLMGTARFEREAQERAQEASRRAAAEHRRAGVARQQEETRIRMAALQAELDAYQRELDLLDREQQAVSADRAAEIGERRRLRGGRSRATDVPGNAAAG
jgi:circadian clock protein KaiC